LRLRAGQGDDQVGAGIALGLQAQRPRPRLDDVERGALALAVAFARNADAVAGGYR